MSKNLTKKIAIVILIVLLFSFIVPLNSSQALTLGGVLSKPITSFCMLIFDGINTLLTLLLKGQNAFDAAETALKEGNEENIQNYLVDPSGIFANDVPMLNANIFEAKNEQEFGTSGDSLGVILKKVVKSTYETIRNLSAVILLVLLIYTGIRIVLASNSAQEKAKWNGILLDWVKALALVVFVHIIMIGIFSISDKLVASIKGVTSGGNSFIAQIRYAFEGLEWDGATLSYWVLVIMYGYITYMTVIFAIAYLKRLMYIVILIVIAPIIAVTYALGGQQKQIFGKWLKEYIMAVLLQPYHILIYYILITLPLKMLNTPASGDFFDGRNFACIYALVAMSFIRPAERMVRDLVGMNVGVAREGSFDSGQAVVNKVIDVGMKGAEVATFLATGIPLPMSSREEGTDGENFSRADEMLSDGSYADAPHGSRTIDEMGNLVEDENTPNRLTWKQYATERKALREMSQEENLSEADQAALKQAEITDIVEAGGTAEIGRSNGQNLNINSLNVGTLNANNVQSNNVDTQNTNTKNSTTENVTEDNKPKDKLDINSIQDIEPNTQKEKKSLADRLSDSILYGNPKNAPNLLTNNPLTNKIKDTGAYKRIESVKESAKNRYDNPKTGVGKVMISGVKRAGHIAKLANSAEGREKIAAFKDSLDNLYKTEFLAGHAPETIGHASIFIKAGATKAKEKEKKKEEETINQFIENNNNINFMKEQIKEKAKNQGMTLDEYAKSKGKSVDELAKARLEAASKFLKYGAPDVQTADKLLTIKQEKGCTYEKAVEIYSKSDENKQALRENIAYNNFINNSVQMNQMKQIVEQRVAQKEGININQLRSNQELIKTVQQEIQKEIKNAAPYLASGTAKNATDVIRMNRLEQQIKDNAKLAKGANIKEITANTEKIIDKALKAGKPDIKIPNSDRNDSIKAVEKIANRQLEERRQAPNPRQNTPPNPRQNTPPNTPPNTLPKP